jgi:hypothetical protein
MKATIRNSAFMSLALFAALSIATVTKANDDKKEKSVTAVEFKYIGKAQDRPVFELILSGSQPEEFIIRFRDNYGYVFYSKVVKSNFNQKFVINTDEMEGNTVLVEVTSRKTRKTETFTINSNQKLVNETVVARIH